MRPAALYVRSSKDRTDISIATQVHDLTEIARSRDLRIAATYTDAVESGSTDDRPGFNALVDAIRDRKRGWSILLVYDTSRLARRRYIAQAFKHHCRKHDVVIQYAKVPTDIDPISELVLESVFEAMDEVHSLMSRDKAIAGQRENVRRGWRAGGRAPRGYRLEQVATGAVREGKPVTKSRLVPSGEAAQVAAYLKARAGGDPRPAALRAAGLAASKGSLVDMEWNALVYAGHTVYGRHWSKRDRGGKPKRRAREDWTIQRDTHPALITDTEAEALLERLMRSDLGRAVSEGKRAASSALLSGVLVTGDGRAWRAAGTHYRLEGKPGRHVRREVVDRLVLERIQADVCAPAFLEGMVEAARALEVPDRSMPIRREVVRLKRERDRAARLALETDNPEIYATIVAERTGQIEALEREAVAAGRESDLERAVRQLTPAALSDLIRSIEDPARLIESLVARVVLEPDLTGRVEYRAAVEPARSVSVASPPRSARYATAWVSEIRVAA